MYRAYNPTSVPACAHALDSLVYWLIVLEVEFEVLEPPALRERLALAAQRFMRSLARG